MNKPSPRLILFDYGGVFADHYCQPFLSALANHIGTQTDVVLQALSEQTTHGRAYRLDTLSSKSFWEEVRQLVHSNEFDKVIAQDLWAKTYIPNRAMISLANYLKEKHQIGIGLVLNEDRLRLEYVMDQLRSDIIFDVVFASCEVGQVKPDPPYYDLLLQRLKNKYSPAEILVVDDRESHVLAARLKGMQAWHFKNPGAFSRDITNLISQYHDNTHS